MFYEGVDDANRRSIGIAVSKNGRSGWKCHSRQAVVVPDFGTCGVRYHLQALALQTLRRCSVALPGLHHCSHVAVHSKACIAATSWLLCRPILKPSEDDWDSGSVGAPCGVSMADGKWRL